MYGLAVYPVMLHAGQYNPSPHQWTGACTAGGTWVVVAVGVCCHCLLRRLFHRPSLTQQHRARTERRPTGTMDQSQSPTSLSRRRRWRVRRQILSQALAASSSPPTMCDPSRHRVPRAGTVPTSSLRQASCQAVAAAVVVAVTEATAVVHKRGRRRPLPHKGEEVTPQTSSPHHPSCLGAIHRRPLCSMSGLRAHPSSSTGGVAQTTFALSGKWTAARRRWDAPPHPTLRRAGGPAESCTMSFSRASRPSPLEKKDVLSASHAEQACAEQMSGTVR